MSRVSLQDSINPKPLSEGIDEEYPRQLAPSVGSLSAQGRSSAAPVTSAAFLLESPTPGKPRDPVRCGSFEFVPYREELHPNPMASSRNAEAIFGGVHFVVDSGGFLRLPGAGASHSKVVPQEGIPSAATLETSPRGMRESIRESLGTAAGQRKRRRSSHREEEGRTVVHSRCYDMSSIRGRTRSPHLSATEQLEEPCYLHSYFDPKDGREKSSHLLRNYRHFLEI
jgi:hypothetical protein